MKNFKKIKITILIISAFVLGISASVLATNHWDLGDGEPVGNNATTLGVNTFASGSSSLAMNAKSRATGDFSAAMNLHSIASGYASTSMGMDTEASANYSLATGHTTEASGWVSSAFGYHTIADKSYQVVIGRYNSSSDGLFVIGNGDSDTRNKAFVVASNGRVYSNGNYPISDIRLKTNIKTLENPLDKILKLRGVSYYWKPEERRFKGYRKEIGLIAQEVEKVVPELVITDKTPDSKGRYLKSVAYEKTVALLIEGMKEQQKEITELRKEIQKLKAKK